MRPFYIRLGVDVARSHNNLRISGLYDSVDRGLL